MPKRAATAAGKAVKVDRHQSFSDTRTKRGKEGSENEEEDGVSMISLWFEVRF
jgi:hypothetical protein